MACPEGLEPPTCCLEGSCSIQLSYGQTGHPGKVYAMAHSPQSGTEAHRPRQAFSGRQRDSHSALLTTLTLLSAMAAPASMGLSPPSAASGMPMTL